MLDDYKLFKYRLVLKLITTLSLRQFLSIEANNWMGKLG